MTKLILIMPLALMACSNPYLLKTSKPVVIKEYNSCIKVKPSVTNMQAVYARSKPEKVFYYYLLSDFLGDLDLKNCEDTFAVVDDINVLAGFVTVSAGVSVNKFQIKVKAGIYNNGLFRYEKTYTTEVDSKALFFISSNQKKHRQDSIALKQGLTNILTEIDEDIKGLGLWQCRTQQHQSCVRDSGSS